MKTAQRYFASQNKSKSALLLIKLAKDLAVVVTTIAGKMTVEQV